MSNFQILKKRKDFLRAAKDIHAISYHVLLQAARPLSAQSDNDARIGFTATKRLGKAHIRNKTKRRLRAVVRDVYKSLALKGVDYVLVGRKDTYCCPFAELKRDVIYTFKKANKQIIQELQSNAENIDSAD